MASLADRLRYLREKNNYRQKDIADKLGITESAYGYYEQGRREPSYGSLKILSDMYDVTTDYLLGRESEDNTLSNNTKSSSTSELTPKDERNIVAELERILSNLDNKNALAFDGEPTQEDMELLRDAIEHSLRTARIIAKKKFTPKKYKR